MANLFATSFRLCCVIQSVCTRRAGTCNEYFRRAPASAGSLCHLRRSPGQFAVMPVPPRALLLHPLPSATLEGAPASVQQRCADVDGGQAATCQALLLLRPSIAPHSRLPVWWRCVLRRTVPSEALGRASSELFDLERRWGGSCSGSDAGCSNERPTNYASSSQGRRGSNRAIVVRGGSQTRCY